MEGVARLWYFLENDSSVDSYVFALDEGETREIKGNQGKLQRVSHALEYLGQAGICQ